MPDLEVVVERALLAFADFLEEMATALDSDEKDH